MKKVWCLLLALTCLACSACSDGTAKEVSKNMSPLESFEANLADGIWGASYKETFNYNPLYANSSPYSAAGENIVSCSTFEGMSVGSGVLTENQWMAQGIWSSSYSVVSGMGVDNSSALRYYQPEYGKSNTAVKYLLNVKKNTRYTLTAKLKTENQSAPVIKILSADGSILLSQVAGGKDDFWEEVASSFDSGDNSQVVISFIGNADLGNFSQCISGTSYLDELYVYENAPLNSSPLENDYHIDDNFKSWSGEHASGWKWGLSEYWWYSNARVFAYNAVPEIYSPDSSFFRLSGRPKSGKIGYFGVEFTWESKLEKGRAYQFSVHIPYLGETPDIITVNDKIVWSQEYDKVGNERDSSALTFEYAPSADEYARIRFICETGIERGKTVGATRRMIFPPDGDWSDVKIKCLRTETLNIPKYTKYDLHEKTEFTVCGEESAARMLRSGVTATYNGEIEDIPKIDYKASSIKIYENELNVMYDSGVDAIKKLKLDILAYIPSNTRGDTNFEEWAKRAKNAGINHLFLYTVLPVNDKGEYLFTQLTTMLENGQQSLEQGISATTSLANRWLELVPNGRVTICFCELESWFGFWNNGIENAPLSNVSGYESLKNGGLQAYKTVQQYLKELHGKFKAKLKNPDKVEFLSNSSRAGLDMTNLVNGGCDLIYNKGTGRSNYNITLSAARGAGKTFDLPFGVGWDTFDRDYWYGFSNDAIISGFLSLFHGGCDGIFNEISGHNTNEKTISTQGKAWLDGVRYSKTHPEIGETVVNTAIVRGEGDEWFRFTAKSAAWDQSEKVYSEEMNKAIRQDNVPTKWAAAAKAYNAGKDIMYYDTYIGDFSLLDCIYSDFGHANQTDLQRIFTGTPYGPADIISDTAPLDKLSSYKTLIYCGRGQTITSETVKKLEEYVKNGGKLIMAVGQMKDENGNLVVNEFAGISFGKQKTVDKLPYTYIYSDNAELIKRHKNDDPQALYAEYGKGAVALFSGEYLTAYDADVARETIISFLENDSAVTFSKAAKYIEYSPNIKGKSVVIPFINQGRGFYPSGNGKDYGVYNGNVAVDLDAFGINKKDIAVYRAVQSIDGTKPITLEKVNFKVSGGKVIFNVNVAIIDEIVIGPKSTVQKDFFS